MESLEGAISRLLCDAGIANHARISPWPDNPASLGNPVGNAAILIRYQGQTGQAAASSNRGPFSNSRTLSIEIRFLVKKLNNHDGAYSLLRETEAALVGWLPTDSDLPNCYTAQLPGLALIDEQLIDRDDNAIWDWGQLYQLKVVFLRRKI